MQLSCKRGIRGEGGEIKFIDLGFERGQVDAGCLSNGVALTWCISISKTSARSSA